METLPNEILFKIFNYLNSAQLIRFIPNVNHRWRNVGRVTWNRVNVLTCRGFIGRWYELMFNKKTIKNIRVPENFICDDFLRSLRECSYNLTKLDLTCCSFSIEKEKLIAIAPMLSETLETLSLSECESSQLIVILEVAVNHWKQLTTVMIAQPFISSKMFLKNSQRNENETSTTELFAKGARKFKLLTNLPELRSLSWEITCNGKMNADTVENMLANLQNLSMNLQDMTLHLRIDEKCRLVDQSVYKTALEQLGCNRRIRSLDLSFPSYGMYRSAYCLIALVDFEYLKELSLHSFDFGNEHIRRVFPIIVQRLNRLNLSGVTGIHGFLTDSDGYRYPKLKSLCVLYCEDILLDVSILVHFVGKKCPNVVEIEIKLYRCNDIKRLMVGLHHLLHPCSASYIPNECILPLKVIYGSIRWCAFNPRVNIRDYLQLCLCGVSYENRWLVVSRKCLKMISAKSTDPVNSIC